MNDRTFDYSQDVADEDAPIVLSASLQERLVATVQRRHPQKSYGYLISDVDARTPTDFILFEGNIRNSDAWKDKFESYGRYFVEHDDAGFVATPEESWRLQKQIWARGMVEVGVFHSHQRHPANFSQIDYELHMQRFDDLWHLIISMRNPEYPQLRFFSVSRAGVRELPVAVPGVSGHSAPCTGGSSIGARARDLAISRAQLLLQLNGNGQPKCSDSQALVSIIDDLLRTDHKDAIEDILVNGFLQGSSHRYEEHIAPGMTLIDGGRFLMGTSRARTRHFCGESPQHVVELSPFSMARVPVTNELFGLFDQRWLDVPAGDRRKPAVDVTWFDAELFAMWMGCRLPTEAEWELACGGGSEGDWCCGEERLLPRYAWYSENSGGVTHPVGTREPNSFGLFDLHGNVWEWCLDTFDQDYYSRSAIIDPVNAAAADWTAGYPARKVCRGGSRQLFAEMCRTRHRFHEPAGFWSSDLGFRLARTRSTAS